MTEPIIKELGDKLLRQFGRRKAIEACKANKWNKVLTYIEKLSVQGEKNE